MPEPLRYSHVGPIRVFAPKAPVGVRTPGLEPGGLASPEYQPRTIPCSTPGCKNPGDGGTVKKPRPILDLDTPIPPGMLAGPMPTGGLAEPEVLHMCTPCFIHWTYNRPA